MKKAVSASLFMAALMISCAKPIGEETKQIRLPAEMAEASETSVYSHLKKVELRDGDILSRCYFFEDGEVEGEQAVYKSGGIEAAVRLVRGDEGNTESLVEDRMDDVCKRLKSIDSQESSMETGSGYSMGKISYVKQKIKSDPDKTVTIMYPCMYIVKLEEKPDGNYLLMELEIDNEQTDDGTNELLDEFLMAYGITIQ